MPSEGAHPLPCPMMQRRRGCLPASGRRPESRIKGLVSWWRSTSVSSNLVYVSKDGLPKHAGSAVTPSCVREPGVLPRSGDATAHVCQAAPDLGLRGRNRCVHRPAARLPRRRDRVAAGSRHRATSRDERFTGEPLDATFAGELTPSPESTLRRRS